MHFHYSYYCYFYYYYYNYRYYYHRVDNQVHTINQRVYGANHGFLLSSLLQFQIPVKIIIFYHHRPNTIIQIHLIMYYSFDYYVNVLFVLYATINIIMKIEGKKVLR